MIFAIKRATLFLSIFTTAAFSQITLQQQHDYAICLYNSEEYFDAITEFKRLLFFDGKNEFTFEANSMIGKSYKAGAKFDDAIRYFVLAQIAAPSEDKVFETQIEIIRCNILRRTTDRALRILSDLEADPSFINNRDEINYWRGWALMFDDRWKDAAAEFNKIEKAHPLNAIAENINEQLYSVTLAKSLSYIIPGVGQFYTGHYFSGALSLAWNILWGYLTVNAFIGDRIFDGLMVGNLLWFRFYRGNIQNAEKFALEENLKIINNGLKYLQNEYNGEKP